MTDWTDWLDWLYIVVGRASAAQRSRKCSETSTQQVHVITWTKFVRTPRTCTYLYFYTCYERNPVSRISFIHRRPSYNLLKSIEEDARFVSEMAELFPSLAFVGMWTLSDHVTRLEGRL